MSAGGARPGAGRPVGSTRSDRTATVQVRLTLTEKMDAIRLGQGSASAGLREALKRALAAKPDG